MSFYAAQCSFTGARPYNEDTVLSMETEGGFLAVVADGLGGHGGGNIASRVAAETLRAGYLADPHISRKALQALFDHANRAVLEQQTPQTRMQSTAVSLIYDGERLAFAHAGDSRLYHFLDGRLVFQTVDHSVSQMAALAGQISMKEIRFHEDRNRVLRTLGGEESIRVEMKIEAYRVSSRDAFLLCTDGFWEYVWEDEMAVDLSKSAGPEEWLTYMIARIGGRMNGKNDNFSAVALFGRDDPDNRRML